MPFAARVRNGAIRVSRCAGTAPVSESPAIATVRHRDRGGDAGQSDGELLVVVGETVPGSDPRQLTVQRGQVGDRRRGALAQGIAEDRVDVLGAQPREHRLAECTGVRGCPAGDARRHRSPATARDLVEVDDFRSDQYAEVHHQRGVGVQTFEHRGGHAAQLRMVDPAGAGQRRGRETVAVRTVLQQPSGVQLVEDAMRRRAWQTGAGDHLVEAQQLARAVERTHDQGDPGHHRCRLRQTGRHSPRVA